jgi:hypothetical protein
MGSIGTPETSKTARPACPDLAQMGLDLGRDPVVAGQHHLSPSGAAPPQPRHCQRRRSDHPCGGHRAIKISGPKPPSAPPVVAAASRRPPLPPRARPATAGRHAVARATAPPRPCEHAAPALRDRPAPSSQREGEGGAPPPPAPSLWLAAPSGGGEEMEGRKGDEGEAG